MEAQRTFGPRQSKRWVAKRFRQDFECDVPIAQGKPGKNHVEDVVEQLDVEPELADERVAGAVEVAEVDDGVDGGEEGAVQPATTLRDEFWELASEVRIVDGGTRSAYSVRHIRGSLFEISVRVYRRRCVHRQT
jgi:hypothetical protein